MQPKLKPGLYIYIYMIILVRERCDEIGKKIKREIDAAQTGRRNNMMLVPQGGNLNTITPCAACKLLRRRCAEECPFFPYFSPHEPHKFAAVHKVFGASNVSKLLLVNSIISHIYIYTLSLIFYSCANLLLLIYVYI